MKELSFQFVFGVFGVIVILGLTNGTHLESVKADIYSQDSSILNTSCFKNIINIIQNVQNGSLWATWIWDSMQPPVGHFYGSRYHLGNYDECLSTPWTEGHTSLRTQYCLADVTLHQEPHQSGPFGTAEAQIKGKTETGLKFNILTLGICVPAECSSKEIKLFVKVFLKHTLVGSLVPNPRIEIDACQTNEPKPYSVGFYISIFILFIIGSSFIFSNIYLWKETEVDTKSQITVFAQFFCARSNTKNLMSRNPDEIHVLHGIRFISASVIVLFHMWFIYTTVGYGNSIQYDADYKKTLFYIYYMKVIVDTFFFLSGLLTMKNLLDSQRRISPFKMILKRYVRLMFSLYTMIFLMVNIGPYIIHGPLVLRFINQEFELCTKSLWLNLLTLSNYINTNNMCYPSTWSVNSDFHMTVAAILIFWVYQRRPRIGLILFSATAVASIILPALTTYQKQLLGKPNFTIDSIQAYRQHIMTDAATYRSSHLRTGPFLVGVITSYMLKKYKPKDYKNYIPRVTSQLIVGAVITTIVFVMFAHGYFEFDSRHLLSAAVYSSLIRPLWAVLAGVLVAVCEYGSVPLITKFLSWPAFVPLSKLSYGLYVVHPAIIMRSIASTRYPIHHEIYNIIFLYFGVMALSLFTSYVQWLLLEAPSMKITAHLLGNKRQKDKKL